LLRASRGKDLNQTALSQDAQMAAHSRTTHRAVGRKFPGAQLTAPEFLHNPKSGGVRQCREGSAQLIHHSVNY
jgi:hypothetical protein